MSWTDERIEQLRTMWQKGLTASQIAEALGGVSRNAVIGKAHRLELSSRPSPVKAAAVKAAPDPAAPAKAAKPAAAAPAPMAAAKAAAKAPAPVSAKPVPAKAAAPRPTAQEDADARELAALLAAGADDDDDADVDFGAETDSIAGSGAAGEAPASGMTDAADVAGDDQDDEPETVAAAVKPAPRIVSIGPGGFIRQGPGDQQPPIPPAPPRRMIPAKPSADIAGKTSLLDLNDRVCRWPMGHPGEPDFHFCGKPVNPGFPYCVEHCGRAFQAQLPRGTRRPPPPPPFGGGRMR